MKIIIKTISNNNFYKKNIILFFYLFSQSSIAMNDNNATILFKQEFHNHISLSQLPPIDVIEGLLKNKADPNIIIEVPIHTLHSYQKKTSLYTPLLYTCLHNNIELTSLLLEHGADPNFYALHSEHSTPLAAACANKNFSLVELLLNHKAHTDTVPQHRLTPLITTCIKSNVLSENCIKIIKLLLRNGANVNAQRINPQMRWESSLYYADQCNNKKLIALLLNNNATINPPIYHCKLSKETRDFMALRKLAEERLSLAFFYNTTEQTQGLCSILPKEISMIIFNHYHRLKTTELSKKWKLVYEDVYKEQTDIALQFLPFITIKEQLKICKYYYLKQKKKWVNNTPIDSY